MRPQPPLVLDHSFGSATLSRETVVWPGTAAEAIKWIGALQLQWLAQLDRLTDEVLASEQHTRWPFGKRRSATSLRG